MDFIEELKQEVYSYPLPGVNVINFVSLSQLPGRVSFSVNNGQHCKHTPLFMSMYYALDIMIWFIYNAPPNSTTKVTVKVCQTRQEQGKEQMVQLILPHHK